MTEKYLKLVKTGIHTITLVNGQQEIVLFESTSENEAFAKALELGQLLHCHVEVALDEHDIEAERDPLGVEALGDVPNPYAAFKRDLAALINRHSLENRFDMPDFILAMFMVGTLEVLEQSLVANRGWHSPPKYDPADEGLPGFGE